MDGEISAHCKEEEENGEVAEDHEYIDGQKLIELSSEQFEEVHESGIVGDRHFILVNALAVFGSLVEDVELADGTDVVNKLIVTEVVAIAE